MRSSSSGLLNWRNRTAVAGTKRWSFALSWFTDWEFALADAHPDIAINFGANRLLNLETGQRSSGDVLRQARELSDPCWFIHGDMDPRPGSTVEELSRAVPHAKFWLVEGAGHNIWHERPAALSELLRQMVLLPSKTDI